VTIDEKAAISLGDFSSFFTGIFQISHFFELGRNVEDIRGLGDYFVYLPQTAALDIRVSADVNR
jgi:hypothetical protein